VRKVAIAAAFVYGILFPVAFVWMVTHHRDQTMAIVTWVRHAGALGIAAYTVTYAIGSVFLFPIVVMSALGGFLFGPWLGIAVTSPANAIGATCAFLAGRLLLEQWLAPIIASNPRIAAVDRAVGQQGVRLTLLLRLSPVLPHNMLNFALSTTRVKTRDFAIGTWLGALPITTVQVIAGARARDLGEAVSGPKGPAYFALIAAGVVITAFVLWFIARTANRELTRMMEAGAAAESTSPPRS
jgi:uncharacterized membrane protein YdjX (TVP38/TMEM64 family)